MLDSWRVEVNSITIFITLCVLNYCMHSATCNCHSSDIRLILSRKIMLIIGLSVKRLLKVHYTEQGSHWKKSECHG